MGRFCRLLHARSLNRMSYNSNKPIEVVLADPNPLILSFMYEKFSPDPRFSLVSTVVHAGNFISTVYGCPLI